jgi:hypothetical protein
MKVKNVAARFVDAPGREAPALTQPFFILAICGYRVRAIWAEDKLAVGIAASA